MNDFLSNNDFKINKIKKEIESLRELIRHHNWRYYAKDLPEISDTEYDNLIAKLNRLEDKYPHLITPDSPTQRVGGRALSSFSTVVHKTPMLSLANTYSIDEVLDFDQRVKKLLEGEPYQYVVELKIDGVAISLIYEKGIFVIGSTRGDGIRGDDITNNLKTIYSIPLKLQKINNIDITNISLEVRGEVFMNRADFDRYNEFKISQGESPFANPRNATSGSLKLLDPNLVAKRPLDIFIYSLVNINNDLLPLSHGASLELLANLGFRVNPSYRVCADINEVISYCNIWKHKKETLPYDIDGMVIKVNSLNQQKLLDATSKNPRWAIAYKYPAKQATTVISDIKIQVGRTGILTPVAILAPVTLSGSVINRATLHNMDEIKRKDIRIGDRVIIEKGGEIIPKIIQPVLSVRDGNEKIFNMPDRCPVCNSNVVRLKGEDLKEEAAHRCISPDCFAQAQRRIQHFASRDAMNIQGLGPAVIEQLLNKKLVKDYGDLYYLEIQKLSYLERMAEKSAQNLALAIEESKNRPFPAVLFALGILHVGVVAAEILAKHFISIDKLSNANEKELISLDGVGKVIAKSIISFLQAERTMAVISKLKEAGLKMEMELENSPDKRLHLAGISFIFTGTLNIPRKEAQDLVKDRGGIITSSVNKKTNYLVVGDNPGSKLAKAKSMDVKILTQDEFLRLIRS